MQMFVQVFLYFDRFGFKLLFNVIKPTSWLTAEPWVQSGVPMVRNLRPWLYCPVTTMQTRWQDISLILSFNFVQWQEVEADHPSLFMLMALKGKYSSTACVEFSLTFIVLSSEKVLLANAKSFKRKPSVSTFSWVCAHYITITSKRFVENNSL